MTPLVVIDERIIRTILADQRFLNTFPCLVEPSKSLRPQRKCSRCNPKEKARRAVVLERVKVCLRDLSDSGKRDLKRLLQATRVRIVTRNARGARVEWTF